MCKRVWYKKNNFWQNDSNENLDDFSLNGFCIYKDSAFMGRPTPTTAFAELIKYFTHTM